MSVPTGIGNYPAGVTDNDPHFGRADDDPDEPECVLSDDQISDVLMVGYGYHREWDYLYERPKWVKGWLPGAPTNPLNAEDQPEDDDILF
jgi:hypothetical protein